MVSCCFFELTMNKVILLLILNLLKTITFSYLQPEKDTWKTFELTVRHSLNTLSNKNIITSRLQHLLYLKRVWFCNVWWLFKRRVTLYDNRCIHNISYWSFRMKFIMIRGFNESTTNKVNKYLSEYLSWMIQRQKERLFYHKFCVALIYFKIKKELV